MGGVGKGSDIHSYGPFVDRVPFPVIPIHAGTETPLM